MSNNRKAAPEGFVLYGKTLQSALLLPDDAAGRVLKATARLFLTGEVPGGMELSEQIVFALFQADIDGALARHAEVCARNQKIAANRRPPSVTSGDGSLPLAPNRNETNRTEQKRTETKRTEKKSKADKPPAHAHGQFGWVKLTDEQYTRLVHELGQAEVDRCIQYVDESAQATGNKNRWKDWNLVLRRCSRDGWGRRDAQSGSDIRSPARYTYTEEETL